MRRYLIYLFFILIFIPENIYALCSDEEINLYKRNEDKFKITSEFNYSNEKFTLVFHNPLPDSFSFGYIGSSKVSCNKINEFDTSCSFFNSGGVIVAIKGISNTCNETIYKYVYPLYFNSFYSDTVCDGVREFVLCSPTYDKEISYEDFVYRVNLYKETKKENSDNEDEVLEENNIILDYFYKIRDFVIENYVAILIVMAALILLSIIIIMLFRRYKRRWRLE